MNEFEQYANKLGNINVIEAFLKAVKKHDDYLNELINNQLEEGKDGNNSVIRPMYSANYKKFKRNIGMSDGIVNLKVTGEYYKSRKTTYTDRYIEIFSEYNVGGFNLGEHLRDRYGKDIEKISKENEELFLERIYTDFIKNAFRDL